MRALLIISVLFVTKGAHLKAQITPIPFFHPDTLKHWVSALADDSMQGRFTGSPGAMKAADLITNEFRRAGLYPLAGNDGYFMSAGTNWGNVMGALKGRSKPGQVIIFSAHYDHIGTISTDPYPGMGGRAYVEPGDTIYNGANDDASGVSAVLALANYFAEQGDNERTLLFIAFAGEEQVMLGSGYLASLMEADSIVAMINIEMIGRGNQGAVNPYITGKQYSDLQKILNKNLHVADPKKYGRSFFKDDLTAEQGLFMRSDNYPFALKKVPAHTIMVTSPYDEYYHNLNDEADMLDYKLMSRVVTAIALSVKGLVNGTDTPSRIRGLTY